MAINRKKAALNSKFFSAHEFRVSCAAFLTITELSKSIYNVSVRVHGPDFDNGLSSSLSRHLAAAYGAGLEVDAATPRPRLFHSDRQQPHSAPY
jgi:hypothetical protein